jgi:tRNA dimethylallyltransferase
MTDEPSPTSRDVILTVVGPTAVGKTSVAISLARELGGEIVSADSRQIYRGMDIGTAKPTPGERAQAPHHLIDIVEPSETYDAARYAEDAERVIARLVGGRDDGGRATPIVAGGTGFYLESLFEGLFEGAGRFPDVRQALATRAQEEGAGALHAELMRLDPASASRIHENDSSRIIRALEVLEATGKPLSQWHREPARAPSFHPRYVGLSLERDRLVDRIDRRVDAMIEAGLVEEIEGLVASGALSSGMPGASAVGYRELLPLVETGGGDLDVAVERIKVSTRRYAKRQMTWFRSVGGVEWFDAAAYSPEEIARLIISRGVDS